MVCKRVFGVEVSLTYSSGIQTLPTVECPIGKNERTRIAIQLTPCNNVASISGEGCIPTWLLGHEKLVTSALLVCTNIVSSRINDVDPNA